MRKVLAGILSFCMLLPFCTAAGAVIPESTSRVWTDFSNCPIEEEYSGSLSGTNISFISDSSQIRGVKGENAIDGVSVESKLCDFRWWSIDKYDDEMYLGFSVKLLSTEDGADLRFGIMSQDAETLEEIQGGLLAAIDMEDGKPALLDHDRRAVAALEENTVYDVGIFFRRGEQTYTMTLNGEEIADDCDFGTPLYIVRDMRINTFSGTFVLDNFYYETKGRVYPQQYSNQEAGVPMPELLETTAPDDSETYVYVNDGKEPVVTGTGGAAIALPLQKICEAAGYTFTRGEGDAFTLAANGVQYTGSAGETVSAEQLNELLGAKIWFDEATNTMLITTGEYRNDGILRAFRGKLYQNGQTFYQIGFNKFELFWQVHDETTEQWEVDYPDHTWAMGAAEEALAQLQERGFRSIRVFVGNGTPGELREEASRKAYFDSMEVFFDLCAKYDIQVVVCMNLLDDRFVDAIQVGDTWVYGAENLLDMVADPNSKSRQFVREYVTEMVTRFRDHKSVLMWEISNEGNLMADVGEPTNNVCYSLLQLAEFYGDMADVIRAADPKHLLTTGDSVMRSCQWNLLRVVLSGKLKSDSKWKTDTQDERRTVLAMLNEKFDVISLHSYNTGTPKAEMASDPDGKAVNGYMQLYMDDAAALGRPLYIGETALEYGITDALNGEDTPEKIAAYLDTYVDAGVQLTHYWAFHTDRKTQYDTDLPGGIRPGVGVHDQTLAAIQAANRKLQETYVVNGAPDGANAHSEEDALAASVIAAKNHPETQETIQEPAAPQESNSAAETPSSVEETGSSVTLYIVLAAALVCAAAVVCGVAVKKKK